MNENEKREAELRLSEDIRVVESLRQLQKFKYFKQLQDSFITPNIRRMEQELKNAARHCKGEEYIMRFYSIQGALKFLEKLEDVDDLVAHYDSEIKGLKESLKNAKT